MFSILRNDDFNFLSSLNGPERHGLYLRSRSLFSCGHFCLLVFLSIAEFRNTVVTAILATDMACHFDYVKKIQERINKLKTDRGGLSLSSKDDRALLSATIIKSADISNAVSQISSAGVLYSGECVHWSLTDQRVF
jgi:hypothetical protein